MKTSIPNPQFQNQLLRLNEAQTHYPESVLDDFFQWYHLQDTRPILWQWLIEVLSSPRDSNNDPHERNNDIFFYEKLEALVEAAWVLRRGNNQKTKHTTDIPKQPLPEPNTNPSKTTRTPHFSKPPRLIEKATAN